MAVFGGNGIFPTLFSQFHIVHTYETSHHTIEEPWDPLLKATAPRF